MMITARTDVVGSMLRPPELLQAQKDLAANRITQAEFKAIEDHAVDEADQRIQAGNRQEGGDAAEQAGDGADDALDQLVEREQHIGLAEALPDGLLRMRDLALRQRRAVDPCRSALRPKHNSSQ